VCPPRRRRSDPELLRELGELAGREPRTDLAIRIRRSGLGGAPRERLRRETGLEEETLERELAALRREGAAEPAAAGTWLDATALANLEARLLDALEAWHAGEPLQPGMPAGALRGRLPANVSADASELALARLLTRGAARVDGDLVRLPGHRPTLGPEQEKLAQRILAQAREAGLEPPGLREWAERLGCAPEQLRGLLAHLEREGRLVRAREDLWFDRAAVDALRGRVIAHLREHGRLKTPAYKALIGTSRRTAVPLMEFFDDARVTLRRGEARLLNPSAR